MDQELKQYLEGMEARTATQFKSMSTLLEARTATQFKSMSTLLTDVKESLERQINTGFEDMASRFEAQSNRLDRQAALIQTGARWTNRMNDWAENVDVALDKRSQEIAELRARLEKLEGKKAS